MTCHIHLRDVFIDLCHSACLGVKVEVGSHLTPDLRQSCPANVLVADWEGERPAACDFTVTSPLTPSFLNDAGMSAGIAAATSESQKDVSMTLSAGYVFLWPLRHMETGAEKYIPHSLV